MPPIDLHQAVRNILASVRPLPPESHAPVSHFRRTSTDILATLTYLQRKTGQVPTKPALATRHLNRLRQMALVSLVENLERFFKELAGICIDVIAPLTADDRLDTFRVGGAAIAGHFGADTLGRALCESGTWLDCKTIHERFRDILHDATVPDPLTVFQLLPQAEKARYDTLQLIWQLRHSVVHNVGVITHSDAVKLRVLSRRTVTPLHSIEPTPEDIDYLAKFLGETAELCNSRVSSRLSEVLTRIHREDPTLFDPTERAAQLADQFLLSVTVAGATALPPT
jgi:hypothetical protein